MSSMTKECVREGHGWRGMLAWLTFALLALIIASLCIGPYPLDFWQAGHIAAQLALPIPLPDDPGWSFRDQAVIQVLRLPRVLLAVYVGMALGVAGAALQGMMRNPLVGPDLVGVSSGAACGGVLAIMLNLDGSPPALVGLAFFGGMLALACTQGLVRLAKAETNGIALVVAGIFVGALFTAGVSLGYFLANDRQISRMTDWLLGTFAHATPAAVVMVAVPTLIGGSVLMMLRWRFNILSLDNLDIASLGVKPGGLRWAIIVLVSWMVAAQVSVSGVIAWVGLVAPHAARLLVGPDHRQLLPASALVGGLFTLLVDDIARGFLKADVPVGVLTTLMGTPLICWLFWKRKLRGWNGE